MKWRDFGFLLAFTMALLPLAAKALWQSGLSPDLAAWFPLAFVFGLVPLIDASVGRSLQNWNTPAEGRLLESRRYFRVITWLVVPVWLLTLAWCLQQFVHAPFGWPGSLGWVLSTGVLGGALAINTAHELIHKSGRLEPALGGLLLSSVGYHGFKIEHVRGHHVHVATPEDSSSARLGESVYAFVPRALWLNVRNAWILEWRRLRQRRHSPWSWRNEMLRWSLLWITLAALAWAWASWRGLAFFLAQGLVAAATLEIINYVEHYGLERRQIAPGRYERVSHKHSWNTPQRYTNWLLFNLQRHSDHHAHARRRYQALLHHQDSPQLPTGYSGMLLLALCTPLWRRIMDPRAIAYRRNQAAS
ncbi:MAG: alkane 1-monooxygenase [Rhodanobacteraceae bacterium]